MAINEAEHLSSLGTGYCVTVSDTPDAAAAYRAAMSALLSYMGVANEPVNSGKTSYLSEPNFLYEIEENEPPDFLQTSLSHCARSCDAFRPVAAGSPERVLLVKAMDLTGLNDGQLGANAMGADLTA
ncbi:hypothetical protein TeGR_g634 [Tetraparma gracilis]|uniref:Uncharacterized protein n=1 Tax=Tetraparma gracilis TaxID=2962635 RepID=A0ABQ6MU11_9STRA|nr:hypothetical protein TeGR_g634 [Tetraparma gracilis]